MSTELRAHALGHARRVVGRQQTLTATAAESSVPYVLRRQRINASSRCHGWCFFAFCDLLGGSCARHSSSTATHASATNWLAIASMSDANPTEHLTARSLGPTVDNIESSLETARSGKLLVRPYHHSLENILRSV